jgi:hypothetical protein
MAAALTDENTIVIACDAQIDNRGGPTDAGVWTTVSRDGGAFSPEQQITATGNGPSLAAFGRDNVVLSYTPPRSAPTAPWSAPAIATLGSGDQKFGSAGQYPGAATGDVPFVFSGGGSNSFAVDWQAFGGHTDVARIGVGGPSRIGTPHSIGDTVFPPIGLALDHRGDTLVAGSHARKVSIEVALAHCPCRCAERAPAGATKARLAWRISSGRGWAAPRSRRTHVNGCSQGCGWAAPLAGHAPRLQIGSRAPEQA